MKRTIWAFLLYVPLFWPLNSFAQDPSPAQLQQIQADVQSLLAATSADVTSQAVVASDQAGIIQAQTQLAADQASATATAGAVKAAESQLIADVNALLSSTSASHATFFPDKFADFADAFRSYRKGTLTGSQLPNVLAAPRLGRTPNPQRICTAIELANVIGPIVESMMQPPGKWTPIPLPPFCLSPTPSGAIAFPIVTVPVPDAIPAPMSSAELQSVSSAVLDGMFDVHRFGPAPHPGVIRGPPVRHLTGAIPTPRAKIFAAPKHTILGATPAQLACVPPQLSMWGNSTYGDCVSAEEAFAVAAYSCPPYFTTGPPSEQFISESALVAFASQHGLLNGANLDQVMQLRQTDGIVTTSGTNTLDGPYSAVDGTNRATLCNAISIGPIKTGIAAGQLQGVVGSSNGWYATGWRQDQNEDHCVDLCGYGTYSYLCSQLGVTPQAGVDPNTFCYEMFTWSTVGIIDEPSMLATCGEWWLRNPTTVVGANPTPQPTPSPQPTPAPTPTRRATEAAATLAAMFAEGDDSDKAEVLSVIQKAEATAAKLQAKHGKKVVR